ncbi:MAG: D-lactate dehydrogenase (cytochrome) [Cryomorphaceae bacterium]|jgi:D-lactate dehydrogenase (cytochrome)
MNVVSEDTRLAIAKIEQLIGERITTNATVCDHHGHDESWHESMAPDAVCFAQSVEEVRHIAATCHEYHVPLIPYGTGTGMAGQVVAEHGGICLDLSQMNKITQVNTDDFDCTVQAGVTRNQLNEHLRATGLFFSVDPGADASIGGMAATRASGTNTVRYGTMRDNVISLTVVLADGRVIRTAGRARKSAAGYDLTGLFVGSEGTMGIIVEVCVKLHGVPEAISAASLCFDTIDNAVDAVIATLHCNIPMARIELLDEAQIRAINRYSKTEFEEKPTLFIEFHGSDASVAEQAQAFGEICSEFNSSSFDWTTNTEQRSQMWSARHNAAYAAAAYIPGHRAIATDVCVPISRLAECIRETRRDIEQSCTLTTMLAGHVGDGNFHQVFLLDPNSETDFEQFKSLYARLIQRAIDMDGTCSGEHGIGIGKRDFMIDEFGEATIEVMTALKWALDPTGIMNPGKKLPSQ